MSNLSLLGMASMLFVVLFTYHEALSKDSGTGQSKRDSLIEAWTNIVIGFSVNFVSNLWLIPLMTGGHLPAEANWWGGWIYTTISIVRQYTIRRWFNTKLTQLKQKLS